MVETFIKEYYLWVAIPTHIILFILIYVNTKGAHAYMDNQVSASIAAWAWPFSITILLCAAALGISYLVLTAIGISATWVADKTIGRLIKEKEVGNE